MKRICLFAGYNYQGIISSYVIHYISELSRFADIYYLADGNLRDGEIERLAPYVKGAWVEDHGKYDFGSYSELSKRYVGWDLINQYDELLLVNDSCICVNSFSPVFEKMDEKADLDLWGLLATDEQNIYRSFSLDDYLNIPIGRIPMFCVGSYFLGVRKKMFSQEYFKNFLNKVEPQESRMSVCFEYEMKLIQMAIGHGCKISCFFETVYRYSTLYMKEAFNFIRGEFPLLKVRIFVDNIGGIRENIDDFIKTTSRETDFDFTDHVREIRDERKCSLEKCKNKKAVKSRWKEIENYIVPPVIHDAFRLPKKLAKRIKNRYNSVKSEKTNAYEIKSSENSLSKSETFHFQKETMVVFFNVTSDIVSGGMLSIDRFISHSKELAKKKDFDLVLSMLPLSRKIKDNKYFKYSLKPIEFEILAEYKHLKKLVLNIPELYLPGFFEEMSRKIFSWLYSIPHLHINILNQNDCLMPHQFFLEEARFLSRGNFTITAAHKRYATSEKSFQYGAPIYLLTPFLPEFYRRNFSQKKNIIVFSDDPLPRDEKMTKEQLMNKIERFLPEYKVRIVRNMTFESYKNLISEAKYAVTFGEGYDGYFLEPYLSDSISFAVYNETFFPNKFEGMKTVYSSWDELFEKIIDDIKHYDSHPAEYEKVSRQVESVIREFTNDQLSEKNLEDFYEVILGRSS